MDTRDPQTYAIIGVAMEVYNELGSGFLEGVYQDAMEIEFQNKRIPYSREYSVPIQYKGNQLGTPYRADFYCYQSIIVELKAIQQITDIEIAQTLHYLKATSTERGLLINFGKSKLDYKRLILSKH